MVDSKSGTFKKSEVRTSSGAAFGRGHDEVTRRIESRIASVTMIPVGKGTLTCSNSSYKFAICLQLCCEGTS